MNNEKIFITGGAGFLGKNLIKHLYKNNEITIFSRDEAKHYYLKKIYPKIHFIIGDIRNRELLLRKTKNHTVGIFAASLKQIEACNDNYEEANQVIIQGAFNSRLAAEENYFKSACFISSDKSRAATTIYGAMKYVAGESFIAGKSNCKLTTAIYGNVMNSTGSIIPLIWESIKYNTKLKLYGKGMTRFLLDINEAIELILKSINHSNCNIIPVAKSFNINDLFDIYSNNFNFSYEIGEPRACEKIHEIMASEEEIRRMEYIKEDNIYKLYPEKEFNSLSFINNEYSSKDFCLNKQELEEYLKERNYFKP
jgi:UDP-glucose 4-epimerase